jgi:hypothetical protein
MQSVEETNAALAKELAVEELKEQESLTKSGESNAPEAPLPPKSHIRRGSSEFKCFHRT